MLEIFVKGGPIMWPLLITSVTALAVTIERAIFIWKERAHRDPALVEKVLQHAERGQFEAAARLGTESKDFVARTLAAGIAHRETSLSNGILRAANQELKRFGRGIPTLDTIVTLAPLLGLLGTVTGMIRAFGLLGGSELDAPTAITGGIAEALIATAYGLGIAIVSLLPFNYLNSRLDEARHELEDASNHLEIIVKDGARPRV